jgi:hypothetical protein
MEGSLVAYKVFTNGSTLPASEVNENLMQQAVATFSNEAARTAAITSPVEGQLTYLSDSNSFEAYDGSDWVRRIPASSYFAMAAGLVTVPGPSPSGPQTSVAVTFPASRFSVAPIVTTNNTSSINVMPSASSVTDTGFTMNLRHVDNTNFSLGQNTRYIAVQMTSTTAEG